MWTMGTRCGGATALPSGPLAFRRGTPPLRRCMLLTYSRQPRHQPCQLTPAPAPTGGALLAARCLLGGGAGGHCLHSLPSERPRVTCLLLGCVVPALCWRRCPSAPPPTSSGCELRRLSSTPSRHQQQSRLSAHAGLHVHGAVKPVGGAGQLLRVPPAPPLPAAGRPASPLPVRVRRAVWYTSRIAAYSLDQTGMRKPVCSRASAPGLRLNMLLAVLPRPLHSPSLLTCPPPNSSHAAWPCSASQARLLPAAPR